MSGGGSPEKSAVKHDEGENNGPTSTAPGYSGAKPDVQPIPPRDDVIATASDIQQANAQAAPQNSNSSVPNSEKPEDSLPNRLPMPPLKPPSSSSTPPGQQLPPGADVTRSPGVVTESSHTHESSMGIYRPLMLEASPRKPLRSRFTSRASSDSAMLLPSEPTPDFPGSPTDGITALGSSTGTLSPGSPPVTPKWRAAGLLLLDFVRQSRGSNTQTATIKEQDPPLNGAPSSPKPLVSRGETPGRVANVSHPASPGSPVRVSSHAGSSLRRDPQDAAETAESEGGLVSSPRLPWVTLIVIALQVRAHWNFLHEHYPGRCASAASILDDGHWELVAYAAFHHEDIGHLASNFLPFFCKAIVLESALGMSKFSILLTVLVCLVGLLNVTIAQAVYAITKVSGVHTACAQTFVGVVAAMEVIHRLQFGDLTIHYRELVWGTRPLRYMYLEMVLLYLGSEKNFFPLLSGLLVGLTLVFMPFGNTFTRTTEFKGHVYLYPIPGAPVVFLFAASILAAFVFGPYPTHSTESALTFYYPIGKWWLFPALYIGDAFQLTYVLLSLLVEGVVLEQELGHCGFLRLAAGMLLFVNLVQDVLTWTVWKHSDAFFGDLPPAVRHSSTCSCGLVGTLLALKIVRHKKHPEGVFQMASFDIPLPFWLALVLELVHLHLFSSSGSSFGHVTGVLAGTFVTYRPWDSFAELANRVGSSSDPTTLQTQ